MASLHCTNHVYLNSSAVRRALTGESSGELDPSIILKKSQTPRGFQPAGGRRREEVESLAPTPRPSSPPFPAGYLGGHFTSGYGGPQGAGAPSEGLRFRGPGGEMVGVG